MYNFTNTFLQINLNEGEIIDFRTPNLKDAPALYDLVDRSKPLDLNSRYCYMLICTHFRNTSIVAESQEGIVGMVSGYFDPDRPETLFVWQVAVDASQRGKGVALEMLKALLTRPETAQVKWVHTTISPSNTASRRLFIRLADELGVRIKAMPWFSRDLFGGEAHEDEDCYQLGPITAISRSTHESI